MSPPPLPPLPPPPPQTMQMQLPLRLKPRLGHKPPIKSKPKQLTMCSTVHFTYRCGCTHTTTFECPDTASTFSSLAATDSHSRSRRNRPRRRRRCYGPKSTPTITSLDEDCHDCAQKQEKTGERIASFGDSHVSSFSLLTDVDADTETELDTDTSMTVSTSTSTSISSIPSIRASSPLDMSILKERDPNLPSKCSLISILDLDLDLDLRMELIDMDLPEPLVGFEL